MSHQNVFYAHDNLNQQTEPNSTSAHSRQNSRRLESSPNVRRDEPRSPRVVSSRTLSTQELSRCNNASYREIPVVGHSTLTRDGSGNQLTVERNSFRKIRSHTGCNEHDKGGEQVRTPSRSPIFQNRSVQDIDRYPYNKEIKTDFDYKPRTPKSEYSTGDPMFRDLRTNRSGSKNLLTESPALSLSQKLISSIRNLLGPQEARELDAYLQLIHSELARLAEESTTLKFQIDQVQNSNTQYHQNQLHLSDKNSKLESVIKAIRDENRVLRSQVQDLSIVAHSNKTAEELFSRLEEEKKHQLALASELENVKGQMILGQQAYLDLVNEYNKVKLMALRPKSGKGSALRKTQTSNLASTPKSDVMVHTMMVQQCDEQDSQSQIINDNIKVMLNSINNVTLDSRYMGTSDILKKKLDSTFNYGTVQPTRHEAERGYGQFKSYETQTIASHQNDQKFEQGSKTHQSNYQDSPHGQGLLSGQYDNQNGRNFYW
jgi:hypothetical protein